MKTTFNIGKYIMFLGAFIWAIETIFFLIRDGLHFHPSCKTELLLDNITSGIILLGWAIMIYVIVRFYDKHFNV